MKIKRVEWTNQQNHNEAADNDEVPSPLKKQKPATIKMPPKIYRPPIPSSYIEPEELPDPLEGMECLHKPLGQSLWRATQIPTERTDIIKFNPLTHQTELHKNTNWEGCTEGNKIKITRIIKDFWDVFAQEGLQNPIIGFQFIVDTGAAVPVCCKIPRY